MRSQALAHLRFSVALSEGRRYPELPHPYRNEFQRDRDRIIHTRAFRRLEDKTQVFTPGFSDHFRNRLTHTIEVSQMARTVAAALGLDEDLTEALALAHDIGHPPFAHSAEEELDRQMQRFGDRFDHNLHSLRIVERFEQRYARFPDPKEFPVQRAKFLTTLRARDCCSCRQAPMSCASCRHSILARTMSRRG